MPEASTPLTTAAYIRREILGSAVINGAFSALAFTLVFGGLEQVPLWGVGNWVFDFLLQGFMVALMATLVPGFLAKRKIKAGTLAADGPPSRLPAALFPRALVLAAISAVAGTSGIALLAFLSGANDLGASAALLIKIAFGAGLGAIVTPLGLRAELAMTRR